MGSPLPLTQFVHDPMPACSSNAGGATSAPDFCTVKVTFSREPYQSCSAEEEEEEEEEEEGKARKKVKKIHTDIFFPRPTAAAPKAETVTVVKRSSGGVPPPPLKPCLKKSGRMFALQENSAALARSNRDGSSAHGRAAGPTGTNETALPFSSDDLAEYGVEHRPADCDSSDSELWDPVKESHAQTVAAAAAFDVASRRCWGAATGCACNACYSSD